VGEKRKTWNTLDEVAFIKNIKEGRPGSGLDRLQMLKRYEKSLDLRSNFVGLSEEVIRAVVISEIKKEMEETVYKNETSNC